jgi:hypothetical protein
MDKQSINKRLIDQYLSGPDGLERLYRERQKQLSSAHGKAGEDDLPEVNTRVLELAREAGTEIARRHRRRFYVPMALAASVLVAVVAVKMLLLPATDSPDIHMLGSGQSVQPGNRMAEKIPERRTPQDTAEPPAKPETPAEWRDRKQEELKQKHMSDEAINAYILYPAQQVARIRERMNQGRQKEAADSLAALLQQYPDYPVPPRVRDLLRQ